MNIALIGYGKMGQTIEKLAKVAGHEVVLTIDKDNLSDFTAEKFQDVDVAIEFTRPEFAFDNIIKCIRLGVPIVSGTTAWLDRYDEAVAICEEEGGAFFYASNYSIGVNIFFALNKYLAKLMDQQEQYDIEMMEIHHTQKLDAPSGTAITLAEGIFESLGRKDKWEGEGASSSNVLPIFSKREEAVPGTHEVKYTSIIDDIEIKHTAHTREGFAKGALNAALWLVGKKGVFGMKDMLGF